MDLDQASMTIFDLDERGYFWWADEPVPDGHFAPENAVDGLIQIDTNGTIKLTLDDVLPRGPGSLISILKLVPPRRLNARS